MPYAITKRKCKQANGNKGSYVLSYVDKAGKKHRACHTSRKRAESQIAAIESSSDDEITERKKRRRGGVYRPKRGRYTISKRRCRQKRSNKIGSHVMSYIDHNGRQRNACHTSSKRAKRQISKIEKWLKNRVKEESLRRFVRKCLVEA